MTPVIKDPEITTSMVVSTCHIRNGDAAVLNQYLRGPAPMVVYEKGEYGWLVKCDQDAIENAIEMNLLSTEFNTLIKLAQSLKCDWLIAGL